MAYQETVLSSPEGSPELRWSPPNLLLTTLLVAAATLPFSQSEWRVPSQRPVSRELTTATDVRKTFFTDLTPANQSDWPTPRLAIRDARLFQIEGLKTQDAVSSSNVTQQTTWLFSPRQAPLWSAPNLLASSLAPVGAAPFSQSEWATPIAKVYGPPALRTWLETRKTYYVEPVTIINQSEWPIPQAKPSALSLNTWLETHKTYYTETIPIAQSDWPNPLARPALSTLTQWLQLKPSYYVDAVVTSSAVTQQTTLLIGRRPSPIWEPPNLLTSSLAPVTSAAAPFTQADWPTPLLAKSAPISQRTFVFYYVYDDTAPFTPQDWPNPQGIPAHRDLRTWLQGFSVPVQPAPVKPFLQSIWPLPTGTPYPHTLRTWVDWRELGLADLVPCHLTEWPNPTGKPYPVFLRTFTAGEWNTIGPLIVQIVALPDIIVQVWSDDVVVQLPPDPTVERA
jgi:hypothetical protein